MGEIIRIGLDTSKHVFVLHGVDAQEQPVLRRQLRRGELESFFAKLPPTLVGLEACGAAHHWARLLQQLGHQARLLPPQYVKPYVKRGKSDARDAEAICEAMSRPSMRFVPVKLVESQAALMLHGARDLLVKQRTMLVNAIRGHAAELGVCAAKGPCKLAALLQRIAADETIPALAREILALLGEQLAALAAQIEVLERRLLAWHRASPLSRRLATIPGIGPIAASALAMKVPEPKLFQSGRHFAAWLGLTPKDHATGGRQRLGGITRAGDETLRRLLVVGATAVVQHAKPGKGASWLLQLLARKPRKLAAVAWANKAARVAWAMMISGAAYELRGTTV
jgi:transposase